MGCEQRETSGFDFQGEGGFAIKLLPEFSPAVLMATVTRFTALLRMVNVCPGGGRIVVGEVIQPVGPGLVATGGQLENIGCPRTRRGGAVRNALRKIVDSFNDSGASGSTSRLRSVSTPIR